MNLAGLKLSFFNVNNSKRSVLIMKIYICTYGNSYEVIT